MKVSMDQQPTQTTVGELKVLVDKAAEALVLLADQTLALYVVNAVLMRALHQSGAVDISAIGAEACRVTSSLSPGVLAHIKALTGEILPSTIPEHQRLTVIEGGKADR